MRPCINILRHQCRFTIDNVRPRISHKADHPKNRHSRSSYTNVSLRFFFRLGICHTACWPPGQKDRGARRMLGVDLGEVPCTTDGIKKHTHCFQKKKTETHASRIAILHLLLRPGPPVYVLIRCVSVPFFLAIKYIPRRTQDEKKNGWGTTYTNKLKEVRYNGRNQSNNIVANQN